MSEDQGQLEDVKGPTSESSATRGQTAAALIACDASRPPDR